MSKNLNLANNASGLVAITTLHEKALLIAQKYHQAECELIDILQKLDQQKVFVHMGYSSLFDYAVKALTLSEASAANFITVMRKAKIIPELKLAIEQGELSVSKARKITPVITRENSPKWIELAQTLPKNKLEQAVAKEAPKTLTPEKTRYVTEDRLELKLGVSEEIMKKLKRVQNIVSQKTKQAASYEDTLNEALSFYLEKLDPLEKAKRNLNKNINNMKTINVTEVGNKNHNTQICMSRDMRFDQSDQQLTNNTNERQKAKTITINPQTISTITKPKVTNQEAETGHYISAHQQAYLEQPQAAHRQALPAQLKQQIILRDQNRCTHINARNERCENERWLEIHHKVPVAKSGENTLENLATLCAIHHKQEHL